MVSEFSDMIMIGASDGLTSRMVGCAGRFVGSWDDAALMAAWTCSKSVVRFWPSSNCSVMAVEPCEFTDVIWVMPGMCDNCRSSGVATFAGMVSGLAPGRLVLIWTVGKSTLGN